jgi:lipopolysaccharide transport system permease protein
VRRPGFPVAVLPVTSALTHATAFVLALPVLLAAVAIENGLSLTLLALPVIAAVQLLLVTGPAYLLATLNVEYRDTSHLLGVVLVPLFYATPVFYAAAQVPDRYRVWYGLNPIGRVIDAYRDAVFGRWPDPWPIALVALAGAFLAVAGRGAFERSAYRFAEDLG